jgi:hypothetical protein
MGCVGGGVQARVGRGGLLSLGGWMAGERRVNTRLIVLDARDSNSAPRSTLLHGVMQY